MDTLRFLPRCTMIVLALLATPLTGQDSGLLSHPAPATVVLPNEEEQAPLQIQGEELPATWGAVMDRCWKEECLVFLEILGSGVMAGLVVYGVGHLCGVRPRESTMQRVWWVGGVALTGMAAQTVALLGRLCAVALLAAYASPAGKKNMIKRSVWFDVKDLEVRSWASVLHLALVITLAHFFVLPKEEESSYEQLLACAAKVELCCTPLLWLFEIYLSMHRYIEPHPEEELEAALAGGQAGGLPSEAVLPSSV